MATLAVNGDLLADFVTWLGGNVEPSRMNFVGLRGCVPSTQPGGCQIAENTADRYNDTILGFGQHKGKPVCALWLGSVDPGAYYTKVAPMNPKGCAHLFNGQYRYKSGLHLGKYPCLVEAQAVTVWRDKSKDYDYTPDERIETSQTFAIHIHAGGAGNSVQKWSAGCQIIKGGWKGGPYTEYLSLIDKGSGKSHWYTLTDGDFLMAFGNGEKTIDVATTTQLSPLRKEALRKVMLQIKRLYANAPVAELPDEAGVTFGGLLNRLRNTGVLANVTAAAMADPPPAASTDAARKELVAALKESKRLMIKAGLDDRFHARLQDLRQFGPLSAIP